MIVHAQENPGFYTQDLIIGSAIAVGCLVATVVLLVILLRDSWRILQSLIQTTICVLRGEKPPWIRRREEIKRMREKVLSREEAIVRVQQYAEANGRSAQGPFNIRLHFLQAEGEWKEAQPIGRFVYSVNIGSSLPGTVVEIDAIDGTVLEWRTLPR
ncbi:hypothetical protein [Granulicella mallensis]|jgi:hypothetical protein|uniref:PepSY domain-containing protein n=1 Tax=Granulicella mallensis TaxID=940614 RepID=A0A7W7ZSZ8_9BACT|nr:hypothetical protein [Granulicella mallensis]MBB5064706.1 hypothetical protein [Granulicella mallensis]